MDSDTNIVQVDHVRVRHLATAGRPCDERCRNVAHSCHEVNEASGSPVSIRVIPTPLSSHWPNPSVSASCMMRGHGPG